MKNLIPIRRALISVSDKSKLIPQAKQLIDNGIELISTGGSRRLLEQEGIKVKDVSEITNFPEIMDGRVKTLHPLIHGGLLANRDLDTHQHALKTHHIPIFDLLIVNLYPFESCIEAEHTCYEDCIENIDIGGPAMIRAAAKNHAFITVCVDDDDVNAVLQEMEAHQGKTRYQFRQELAFKAFSRTAAYDSVISNWFSQQIKEPSPKWITLSGEVKSSLRYGENPHQKAFFCKQFKHYPGVSTAEQIQGKALSYNNINDIDAAFTLLSDLPREKPAVAIIKHTNPCGVAIRETLKDAYQSALDCDPVSAFGGIIALNQSIDSETANLMTQIFTEAIIAPDANPQARLILSKKKNLRILLTKNLPNLEEHFNEMKTVSGGFLIQTRDYKKIDQSNLDIVTKKSPTDSEIKDMLFAWNIVKHVKSNAIVFAKNNQILGIGAGQTSRIDSVEIAKKQSLKAIEHMKNPVSF